MTHPVFPTPTARDWKGPGTISVFRRAFGISLGDLVRFIPSPQENDGMKLINGIKVKLKNGQITTDDLKTLYPRSKHLK